MASKITIKLERFDSGKYYIWNRGICLSRLDGLCPNMTKDMFNLKKHLRRAQVFTVLFRASLQSIRKNENLCSRSYTILSAKR